MTRAKGQLVISSINFNSHAHVERDSFQFLSNFDFYNFNSHAHVERDKDPDNPDDPIMISTHTLTWSVTRLYLDLDNRL